MRLLIQRVKSSRLEVDGKIISEIGVGYNVFVGVTNTDTVENVKKCANRIATLRLFEDENGKLNYNIKQIGGEILLVSNFTLCDKNGVSGARPDFTLSANKTMANEFYEKLQGILQAEFGICVKMGVFGADMQIYSQLDGPINLSQEY